VNCKYNAENSRSLALSVLELLQKYSSPLFFWTDSSLNCFKRARTIKINPSLAQEPLRYLTLFYNKILLTPTPALG
jgi:hypothetical protein